MEVDELKLAGLKLRELDELKLASGLLSSRRITLTPARSRGPPGYSKKITLELIGFGRLPATTETRYRRGPTGQDDLGRPPAAAVLQFSPCEASKSLQKCQNSEAQQILGTLRNGDDLREARNGPI